MVCLAVGLFSCLDATAKYLSAYLPITQVVWARYATHFLVAAAVLNPLLVPAAWKSRRWRLQGLRGLYLFGATVFNFTAVAYLQLAEAAAIFFLLPLVVALIAVPLLGERIGPRRWAAIVFGFVGVLIVSRPGLGGLSWHVIFSFGAVACYALYVISTRELSTTDSPSSMLIISAGVGVLVPAPLIPAIWVWPDNMIHWLLILLMGVLGAAGHWFVILAYRLAPAPILAPFTYTGILWMIVIGYLLFGDIPSTWTLAGSGIVIVSGLYLLYRERQTGA